MVHNVKKKAELRNDHREQRQKYESEVDKEKEKKPTNKHHPCAARMCASVFV